MGRCSRRHRQDDSSLQSVGVQKLGQSNDGDTLFDQFTLFFVARNTAYWTLNLLTLVNRTSFLGKAGANIFSFLHVLTHLLHDCGLQLHDLF